MAICPFSLDLLHSPVLRCKNRWSQRYWGVVRMAKALWPWRVLRLVLLAGAATLTWMTLSTSAATADASTDSGSLLGTETASVSSLSSGTAPAPVAPTPGLRHPTVGSDQSVAALPAVNHVEPAGTVSTISTPLVATVENAAAGLMNTVAPPLADALESVLRPVADLVNSPRPPVSSLELPAVAIDASADAVSGNRGTTGSLPAVALADEGGSFLTAVGGTFGWTAAPQLASTGTPLAIAGLQSASPDIPWTDDPWPAPAPAGPSTGPGSGSVQSGSAGFAAWLDTVNLHVPRPGVFPVSGSPEHAPSPVSFDPGSSPD